MADDKFAKGLEDVIAGESSICDVDGINGKLIYRGYDIHDLAQNTTFEEVVYLLWNGSLPTEDELAALSSGLSENPHGSAKLQFMHRCDWRQLELPLALTHHFCYRRELVAS